jgi:hypothetical protein
MFTVAHRDAARERVLAMAEADGRVVAAAVVGSLVSGGDAWSDIDLTFAVDDAVPITAVLDDWTGRVVADLDAVVLFDLPAGPTVYRVFLLPGGLQVDLSFTPAAEFGAGGPRFRLLFGAERVQRTPAPVATAELFGWAAVYVREARACVERGRLWQAEHAVNAVRDNALSIACARRGLPARFGRGFDDLPAEVLAGFDAAHVRERSRDALLNALSAATEGLLREAADAVPASARVAPRLRALLDGGDAWR